jgi:pimeloyl-ACP methyl ester carboxylesterase
MAVIVLVHGAWSGSWSWTGVATLLRASGHDVHAPTLTGLAERSHVAPAHVNLSSHVADIAGLLHWNDLRDVVLVGHSYGGMVVTGAADQQMARMRGLIYIDAFVPQSGQSLWDMAGPTRAAAQRTAAEAHDGGFSVPRGRARANSSPTEAGRFDPLFTAHPIACFSEPFIAARPDPAPWPPRHYALCTAYDPSPFQSIAARLQGEPGWTHSAFNALHDVVRTHPVDVASRIEAVIAQWENDV